MAVRRRERLRQIASSAPPEPRENAKSWRRAGPWRGAGGRIVKRSDWATEGMEYPTQEGWRRDPERDNDYEWCEHQRRHQPYFATDPSSTPMVLLEGDKTRSEGRLPMSMGRIPLADSGNVEILMCPRSSRVRGHTSYLTFALSRPVPSDATPAERYRIGGVLGGI